MIGDRFGPLSERPFRLLWLGRTGSAFGDALIPVALAFAVLRIGGGATGLGLVLASYTVGRASFVALGGVWADRLPRRAVMIGADLVRFSTQAATAALLFGHVLHVWELAVLQGIAGAGGGFFVPASTAFVPPIRPRQRRHRHLPRARTTRGTATSGRRAGVGPDPHRRRDRRRARRARRLPDPAEAAGRRRLRGVGLGCGATPRACPAAASC